MPLLSGECQASAPRCASSNFFHESPGGLTTVCVCTCVFVGHARVSMCVRGWYNSARERMRSQQDGFYLVEFIHGANMLSQVILLTSGPPSNARHNSSPWSPPPPQTRFRGRFSWRGNRSSPTSESGAFRARITRFTKSARFRSLPVLAMPSAPTTRFFTGQIMSRNH